MPGRVFPSQSYYHMLTLLLFLLFSSYARWEFPFAKLLSHVNIAGELLEFNPINAPQGVSGQSADQSTDQPPDQQDGPEHSYVIDTSGSSVFGNHAIDAGSFGQ